MSKPDHNTYLQLLHQGISNLIHERKEQEQAKLGHPRGGSSGTLVGKQLSGECHRVALLRRLGIEEPPTANNHIMWGAGENNELYHLLLLDAARSEYTWMPDENIQLAIDNVELPVLGRPDNILCDREGNPALLVELKGCYGASTAKTVFLDNEPLLKNAAQAATYMRALNLPGVLSYTLPSWVATGYDAKKYGVRHITPRTGVFGLEWRGDELWCQCPGEDWRKTCITWDGIESWYQIVQEMKDGERLGPRPVKLDIWGNVGKWDFCGLCSLKPICDAHESDYSTWKEEVQEYYEQLEPGRIEENPPYKKG